MRQVAITLGILVAAILARYAFVRLQPPPRSGQTISARPAFETPEEYLSENLRILMFYPTNPAAQMGRPQTVCYGVVNADSVSIDPPVAAVKPALNHCFSVTIGKPRLLTLTATGRQGEQAVAALMLGSGLPRPAFTSLQLSTLTPKRGEDVKLCYGTNSASSVRLLPVGLQLRPGARECATFTADGDRYTLVAESKGGRDEVPLPLSYVD